MGGDVAVVGKEHTQWTNDKISEGVTAVDNMIAVIPPRMMMPMLMMLMMIHFM